MISVFRVTGMAKGEKFAIDIASIDESHAKEKIFANLGSRFGAKRNEIKIHKIEKIPESETKNKVIKQLHGGQ